MTAPRPPYALGGVHWQALPVGGAFTWITERDEGGEIVARVVRFRVVRSQQSRTRGQRMLTPEDVRELDAVEYRAWLAEGRR